MFENDRKMIEDDTSDRKCLIELIHCQNDKNDNLSSGRTFD
jgi:hypothetical protein